MDFSIILPAFNEAENLALLLKDLKGEADKLNVRYELIVVDDGSADNTQEVLQALKKEVPELKGLIMESNSGFSTAVLAGLKASVGDILGFMDADGQVEAKYMVQAYLKLKAENLDLIKGIRIERYDGIRRFILSKIYNIFFNLMFGGSFQDIGGKPKILTRSLYNNLNLEAKGWFIDNEIMIKAIKGKYKIGELPIIFLKRKKGASKIHFLAVLEYFRDMIYWRFFKKF